ncbi:MAG: acylneuraminate cytidylyltransferase family protein [Bacteroidetes bacterium]|nr:acylneuraminate cytidylyltransferase family protein [Bacteroidota bacterium]
MRGLITICARGGSKGIPGKNIRSLAGKPLIYYTIRTAEEFKKLKDVDIYLSTDSDEIKETVIKYSTIVQTDYTRPNRLATDESGKMDAIIDVKEFAEQKYNVKYDYVMDLDVTAPLRNVEDLLNAYNLLFTNPEALDIFSVSPCHRNPYFNMVEQKENSDFYTLCKQGNFLTRQSSPKVFDMNASFYIYKSSFFTKGFKTAITDKSLIYEVPHLCFDLDNPIDFEFMEFLFLNRKLDFEMIF